jgi:hypothetical protein
VMGGRGEDYGAFGLSARQISPVLTIR